MITWMQRHKKWLVITIWISTIAFVGAGFVGWGSYDYGSKGGAVAIVGDREISVDEYQREYSSLYEKYSQIFGEQFNQEMADKMKLRDVAYKMVIQKNLILSFADDLGLVVTDEEVAKQLVQISSFVKNGKFDKETYIKILQQNRTNPTEFEASLKRELLLQKIESIFKIEANENEVKNLNKLLFSEDDISIKILESKHITLNITDEDVKKYWETNKENYKSEPAVELAIDEITLVSEEFSDKEIAEYYNKFKIDFKKENGKIKSLEEAKKDIIKALNLKATKKIALKKYLKIKKGEEELSNKKVLNEKELVFNSEDNKQIINSIPGDLIKPFILNDKYIIVKVLNKIPAKTLSYEKAEQKVKADYAKVAKALELEKEATKALENFEGRNIGYVSRDSFNKIKDLAPQEALTFLEKLFSSTNKKGKISVGDKLVLYKINNTRLASYDAKKDEAVKTPINNLLNQELMNSLIKNLENQYEVQSSIKIEE